MNNVNLKKKKIQLETKLELIRTKHNIYFWPHEIFDFIGYHNITTF